MVKSVKSGPVLKEKSSEKRKRRENAIKAREQARRYVVPFLVLFFALLAGFLFYRFGTGVKLSPEERAKIRSQRQIARMFREKGGDFQMLQEMLSKFQNVPGQPAPADAEVAANNSESSAPAEAVEEEAVVE